MSTILKALKKLEKEDENRQVSMTDVQNFNASLTVKKYMKPGRMDRLRAGWLWLSLAIIAAAGIVVFFLTRNPVSFTPDSQETTNYVAKVKPPEPKQQMQQSAEPNRKAAEKHGHPVKAQAVNHGSEAASMKPVSEPVTQKLVVEIPKRVNPPDRAEAPLSPVRNKVDQNLSSTAIRANRRSEDVDVEPAKEPAPIQELPASASQETLASLPRLTDGRLRIQAIAWAPAAQDRMAVINNRVLREGHAVDGFTIENIGEYDVVVRQGQQRWKVQFGRP